MPSSLPASTPGAEAHGATVVRAAAPGGRAGRPRDPRRFAERTLELLDAELVELRARDGNSVARAGSADRPSDGGDPAVVVPVTDAGGAPLGELHVVFPTGDAAARWSATLPIVAETAVGLLAPDRATRAVPGAGPAAVLSGQILARLGVEATDYATLVRGIAAAMAPVLDCAKLGIALWSDERRFLQTLPGSFDGSDEYTASSQVDVTDLSSGAVRVWSSGCSEFTNDAGADRPGQRPWAEAVGIRQLITVPLALGDRRIGVLHAANPARDFTAGSIGLVEACAPFAAGSVAAVRDRLESARLRTMADTIGRMATAALSGRGLDALAPESFAEFCDIADVKVLALAFADEDAPGTVVRRGHVAAELAESFLAEAARPRVAVRVRLRRPRAVNDAGWCAVHVPVVADGRRQATLSLLRVPGTPFTANEQRTVRRLANVVSVAWLTAMYQRKHEQAARVEERQRIADDLHDRVAQILFSAELILQSTIETLEPHATVLPSLEKARTLLVRSEVSLREAIHQIAPPEGATFAERLRAAATTVADEFPVPISVDVSAHTESQVRRIEGIGAEVLLRAAREGMVNACKHARPDAITVTLRVLADRARIVVEDDGDGIQAGRTDGYGLRSLRRSLRDAGATLRISPARDGGTRFGVTMPLARISD